MKKFFGRYKYLLAVVILVLAFAVFYISYSVISVNRYIAAFDEAYWSRQGGENKKETVELHKVPGYHDLLKQQGLLGGLVQLAKGDSIGLFLNLQDSVAQLMIKGVSVRDIPIRQIGYGALFNRASSEALYDLFSEPLHVTDFKATIDKEPMNVINAPKDTSDVGPSIKPDTSHMEPVFFILNTDKDLRFYFYQTERGGDDSKAAFRFEMEDRWARAKNTIRSVFKFEVPEYVPAVRIGVSKEDAKVLYRALPPRGQIVVTM